MRFHRLLLRLYPSSFRDEYGAELASVFTQRRRVADGAIGIAWLWITEVVDTVIAAVRVHMDILRQDLRHTWRALRRAPGFAAAAIVVTALGVGATTTAFTLTDHVLLRPLPFPDPDRLVKIWTGSANRPANLRGLQGTNDVGPANYLDWKAMSSSFSVMGAYSPASSVLKWRDEPERIEGVVISASALDTLGVRPAMGRTLMAADDVSGAPCVVLVSNGFWRSRFGGQPWIGTERIGLDSESCAIAGVMPQGFDFPSRTTMFWRPIRFRPDVSSDRRDSYLRVIARLKPGVALEQARADMASVSAALARIYPKDNEDVGAVIIRLRDELNDQSRMLLVAMAGAAGCLLLIACTNLASLVVARATTRARELAVRTAMGAGRARLVRQLLTESLVLAIAGGSLGLLIAVAAIPTAARLVPTVLPIAEIPRTDIRMLLIAAAATVGTGIGFGVLPAFRAARRAGVAGVAESFRTGTSRRSARLRSGLVIAQVSVSIVLLVSAGLLIRTLLRVQATSTGFNTDNVLTMRTLLPWEKYGPQAARVAFYQRVLEKVKTLSGVRDAAYTSFLPMTMRGGIWEVGIPGLPVDASSRFTASARFVTPDYFRAMGIPLTLGRGFAESDTLKSQPIAVVSQKFVSQFLNEKDPLNRRFSFGPSGERTIVGVVGDIRVRGLERSSEPQVYLPYQQQPDNATMNYTPKDLVLRMDPGSDAQNWGRVVASVRQIVREVDPLQPITEVQPLSAIVEGETTARAVQVRVLGAFAALSCLLAAVGLHGLLAFVVSQRTREFGVRLALGAGPGQILALVARRGVILGVSGVVAGGAIAYAAGRWIESLLVGVSPSDAVTFSIAIGISIAVTMAGSLPPAIRAARTNPREAIQTD